MSRQGHIVPTLRPKDGDYAAVGAAPFIHTHPRLDSGHDNESRHVIEEEPSSDSADEWAAPARVSPEQPSTATTTDREPGVRPDLVGHPVMDAVERELAGERVRVRFRLPDGRHVERAFFMGQSIEYLKSQLEEYEGLPYESTTLYMAGERLLDPLSLNDLPFKVDQVNEVEVRLT